MTKYAYKNDRVKIVPYPLKTLVNRAGTPVVTSKLRRTSVVDLVDFQQTKRTHTHSAINKYNNINYRLTSVLENKKILVDFTFYMEHSKKYDNVIECAQTRYSRNRRPPIIIIG